MRASSNHHSRHLAAADLQDAQGACPGCGSVQSRPPVLKLQSDPDVFMLSCAACGISSASHLPTDHALNAYYLEYYEGGADQKFTFGSVRRFARRIAPKVLAKSRMRILDFGGGDGSLSIALAKALLQRGAAQSVDISVVDYVVATDPGERKIEISHYRNLAQATGLFDVILASAILEHIPLPGPAIQQLAQRAAPGALFYARSPYVLPLARLLPGLDVGFPAHIHDMGPAYWRRFADTYSLDAWTLASRPSPVEASLRAEPARAAIAWLLKLPCRIELIFHSRPWWRWVGGWEHFLRFR